MADGIFRRNKGYTVVQNEVIKDKGLSLKAKGLYAIIQCHITIPDSAWRKSYFEAMVTDGRKSFHSAWLELKEKGYLKTHAVYRDGKIVREYELLLEAQAGPHTFYYDKNGEITKTEGDIVLEKEYSEKKENAETLENSEDFRPTPFGYVGNGQVGKGYDGNGQVGKGQVRKGTVPNGQVNNNTNINNTDLSNPELTNQYHNQDMNQIQSKSKERYSMDFLREHYNADYLVEDREGDAKYVKQEDVDNVLDVIYDVLNSDDDSIWMKGQYWRRESVISRLLKLDEFDIVYVLKKYREQSGKIRNHKQYMLALLYDGRMQCSLDTTNRVQQDMISYLPMNKGLENM